MKYIFFLFLLPVAAFSQINQKTGVIIKEGDGYIINGEMQGFSDGTMVQLLNAQTGMPEMETLLKEGRFTFTGKVETPEFKIILFNKQLPLITLFLDNSIVKITGIKEAADKSIITGSVSHSDFIMYTNLLEPYKDMITNIEYNSDSLNGVLKVLSDFIKTHTDSYVVPLAVLQYFELSDDIVKTENLYKSIASPVKKSKLGQYANQLLANEKANTPSGKLLEDFSQADTAGNMVKLSSLRGKYVLVDFWASWCGPCRQENPNLVTAYNKYKSKNFTVLGISLDKAKQAWVNAINMDGLAWTHVSDLKGWNNAVAKKFEIYSIPQNFLLDPQGKIIGKNLRGAALERKLARVLN